MVSVVVIGKFYKIKDSQMARTSQSSQLAPQIQIPLSDIQRPLIYSLLVRTPGYRNWLGGEGKVNGSQNQMTGRKEVARTRA